MRTNIGSDCPFFAFALQYLPFISNEFEQVLERYDSEPFKKCKRAPVISKKMTGALLDFIDDWICRIHDLFVCFGLGSAGLDRKVSAKILPKGDTLPISAEQNLIAFGKKKYSDWAWRCGMKIAASCPQNWDVSCCFGECRLQFNADLNTPQGRDPFAWFLWQLPPRRNDNARVQR